MLIKNISDLSHILSQELVEVNEDLSCEEKSIKGIDRQEKILRNKVSSMIKFLWMSHKGNETTWERKDGQLPQVFLKLVKFDDYLLIYYVQFSIKVL